METASEVKYFNHPSREETETLTMEHRDENNWKLLSCLSKAASDSLGRTGSTRERGRGERGTMTFLLAGKGHWSARSAVGRSHPFSGHH